MIKLNDLIGKPYKAGAKGPNAYDCKGLCLEVANRLGKCLPKQGYWFLSQRQKNKFNKLKHPEPWCIVAFRIWEVDKEKWHVGTVLDDCQRFIHVTGGSSVCIVSLRHPLWRLLLEGYYSYVGQTN